MLFILTPTLMGRSAIGTAGDLLQCKLSSRGVLAWSARGRWLFCLGLDLFEVKDKGTLSQVLRPNITSTGHLSNSAHGAAVNLCGFFRGAERSRCF